MATGGTAEGRMPVAAGSPAVVVGNVVDACGSDFAAGSVLLDGTEAGPFSAGSSGSGGGKSAVVGEDVGMVVGEDDGSAATEGAD